MKLIIAIIQPKKLDDVKKELYKANINLLTADEILGHGIQKGITKKGHKKPGTLLKKIRLEIAVNDIDLEKTINAIIKGAKTGKIGDGKIFVVDLEDCIRIRTGERGWLAIGER